MKTNVLYSLVSFVVASAFHHATRAPNQEMSSNLSHHALLRSSEPLPLLRDPRGVEGGGHRVRGGGGGGGRGHGVVPAVLVSFCFCTIPSPGGGSGKNAIEAAAAEEKKP